MEESLKKYIEAFSRINRNSLKGYKAPHKLVLLIAIADLVALDYIREPKIKLSNMLIKTFELEWEFEVHSKYTNKQIMKLKGQPEESCEDYPFQCRIEYPFFHMQNESFWQLHKSKDYVERKEYSLGMLQTCFDYARIDGELFNLLRDKDCRNAIRSCLISLI